MRNVSINNGLSYCTVQQAVKYCGMDTLVQYMDDDTRERVHSKIAPCSDEDFLADYLYLAPYDLIVG